MSYFDKDFLSFFEELAGDNSKERFDEHRERYHTIVKDPWYGFLQKVIDEVSKIEKRFYLEPKQAVFRINRDIRFSKNKQPYKTHVAAIISQKGRKNMDWPGLYIQLGQSGLQFACGSYRPPKEDVLSIRTAFVENPRKTKRILTDPVLAEYFGELQGEKNKIIPKQFKPYLEKQPIIANKQFYFHRTYPPKEIFRKDLLEFVIEHRDTAKPWNDFLIKAIQKNYS